MDGILTQVTKITYLSVPQTRLIYLKFLNDFRPQGILVKSITRHLFATLNSQGNISFLCFLANLVHTSMQISRIIIFFVHFKFPWEYGMLCFNGDASVYGNYCIMRILFDY